MAFDILGFEFVVPWSWLIWGFVALAIFGAINERPMRSSRGPSRTYVVHRKGRRGRR